LPKKHENLREIVRHRDGAIAAKAVLENPFSTATLAGVKMQIELQIKAAIRAADAFEAMAVEAIEVDPARARRFDFLTSIPGVGTITAVGIIVNIRNLASGERRQGWGDAGGGGIGMSWGC
jgi:transposase